MHWGFRPQLAVMDGMRHKSHVHLGVLWSILEVESTRSWKILEGLGVKELCRFVDIRALSLKSRLRGLRDLFKEAYMIG